MLYKGACNMATVVIVIVDVLVEVDVMCDEGGNPI